jgi:hypothetical protein
VESLGLGLYEGRVILSLEGIMSLRRISFSTSGREKVLAGSVDCVSKHRKLSAGEYVLLHIKDSSIFSLLEPVVGVAAPQLGWRVYGGA